MASIMKYPRIYEISINVCNLEKDEDKIKIRFE
jgi:hypothetical protein